MSKHCNQAELTEGGGYKEMRKTSPPLPGMV